jgi:hypothetical protein
VWWEKRDRMHATKQQVKKMEPNKIRALIAWNKNKIGPQNNSNNIV